MTAKARYRLLCEADHRVLVAAGREIFAELSQGNLKCGGYSVRDGRLSNGFRLPQAIADIQPRKVLVLGEGFLRIELGCFEHFGVTVFPKGYHGSLPESASGDRKLVDEIHGTMTISISGRGYAKEIETLLR